MRPAVPCTMDDVPETPTVEAGARQFAHRRAGCTSRRLEIKQGILPLQTRAIAAQV